jgi:hypothetical protein
MAVFTIYSSPMDLIPTENLEPMEDNSYLSERAIWARGREIERRVQNPKRKETLLDKVRAANELIGGTPRLATEADENPWEFYRLQARLETAEKARNVNHNIRILAPTLPPTALDGDTTDVEFEEVRQPPDTSTQKN